MSRSTSTLRNKDDLLDPFAGLPTIFTVLSKLGLELKRQEAIVPFYTVERIARPAETDDCASDNAAF